MPMEKQYNPAAVEDKWYAIWTREKLFHANERSSKPSYAIVIPPPNVTGILHMGHALNNTIQDILIRLHRMKGCEALWMPGTDHAGIATQNVVERKLRKGGKNRHDLGREAFIEEVWKWKNEHHADHHRPAQEAGRLLRLGPRAVHHGRGTQRRGAPKCSCALRARA